jgi:hypothetical protein
MNTYTVDWNESTYGRAGFSARDLDHALEILEKLRTGELSEDEVLTWKREGEYSMNYTNLQEKGE